MEERKPTLKEKIADKALDICPGWLYRTWVFIKDAPRNIKAMWQRARGIVPKCDAWNFQDSLAEYIKQGITILLSNDSMCYRPEKEKKDLQFIVDFLDEWQKMHCHIYIASDDQEYINRMLSVNPDIVVYTTEQYKEFEKRQAKAFKLLGEHFDGLWD